MLAALAVMGRRAPLPRRVRVVLGVVAVVLVPVALVALLLATGVLHTYR
jgi:hypothetical protein